MSKWLAVIPAEVLSDLHLSSSAKVVYSAIASFTANGNRLAYPSHEVIASRAGLASRSITRLVAELSRAGYITVHRRGRGLTNTYQLSRIPPQSDDAEMCHHNPATKERAGLRSLSTKRIDKRIDALLTSAEEIFRAYERTVRAGGKSEAVRSIRALLAEHSAEELLGCITRYSRSPQGRGEERYRCMAHTFFGPKARFQDFIMETKAPSPPRELKPEDILLQQRLEEAGV